MATVPLPDVPCVRVRMIHTEASGYYAGSRFYIAYSGSAPTGANCATLASDVAAAWASDFASLINNNYALTEVDVLDIATDSGLSGQWTGTESATRSGNQESAQEAMCIEFNIARRYRGGKPRIFMPPGIGSDRANASHWDGTFLSSWSSAISSFFSTIGGLSIGSMGTLKHVNLSYYKGYINVEVPGTRAYAKPQYRDTALHDDVTGYSPKSEIGSQRRRRTATTP